MKYLIILLINLIIGLAVYATPAIKKASTVVQKHEGLELCAYPDGPKGRYSVGYGTHYLNGVPIEKGTCITKHMALIYLEKRLTQDLFKIEEVSNEMGMRLTTNQKVALLSFTYNVGFSKSRIEKILNAVDVCKTMKRYSYSQGKKLQGLKERRIEECKLFNKE